MRVKEYGETRTGEICVYVITRYPILMVHGVFFRDYKFPNYWGRIPKGAKDKRCQNIFWQSAVCFFRSGQRQRTGRPHKEDPVSETGCGELNIIAHSKGGLDIRYAMSYCGIGGMIASVTTINTPHRGRKIRRVSA